MEPSRIGSLVQHAHQFHKNTASTGALEGKAAFHRRSPVLQEPSQASGGVQELAVVRGAVRHEVNCDAGAGAYAAARGIPRRSAHPVVDAAKRIEMNWC